MRQLAPPRAKLVRRRWLADHVVDSVLEADKMLLEHGEIRGSQLYPSRHRARWQARRVIELMVDLRLHDRWQLVEHVEKTQGGYKWAVEYVGRDG